ncbi:MAG: hypothetical protein U5L45_21655 [Saprospiraceae bacterium]|nr:hypothetical protein [Saprospiraceae bacterium]
MWFIFRAKPEKRTTLPLSSEPSERETKYLMLRMCAKNAAGMTYFIAADFNPPKDSKRLFKSRRLGTYLYAPSLRLSMKRVGIFSTD